jgi:hypothetical protein
LPSRWLSLAPPSRNPDEAGMWDPWANGKFTYNFAI